MFDYVVSPIALGIVVLIAVFVRSRSFKKSAGLGFVGAIVTLVVQISLFFTCTNGENYARRNWGLVYDANEMGFFTILFSFLIPGIAIGAGIYVCNKVLKKPKATED